MAVLSVERVSKSFAGIQVVRDVSFDVCPGEVLALVGENGAGKSTVLSLITGLLAPDSGRIVYDGEPVRAWSPHHARTAGISSVHQELSLNPHQTVAENVFLGAWPSRHGLVRERDLVARARPLLERVGLDVDPRTKAGRLPLGRQQLVELAKALTGDPRLLILDEATSALDDDQVGAVFRVVDELRRRDRSVIIVSHRLSELFAVSDRLTVLKDGEVVTTRQREETDHDDVVRLMVGRELTDLFPAKAAEPASTAEVGHPAGSATAGGSAPAEVGRSSGSGAAGGSTGFAEASHLAGSATAGRSSGSGAAGGPEGLAEADHSGGPAVAGGSAGAVPLLRARGLTVAGACTGVDLDLVPGRIVGLGGLQGQGQREVLRALFGLRRHTGSVEIAGSPCRLASPREAIRRGVAYVPEDRKTEGLHVARSVRANLALPSLPTLGPAGRLTTVSRRAEARLVDDLVRRMQIKVASPAQETRRLSGGNQQKVALAKWLPVRPRVLLLAEPTRGIDVGTKREIYHLLRDLASRGMAVLVTSGDTLELVGICDEVAVMYEGRVVDRLRGDELTEERLVAASVTGARPPTPRDGIKDGAEDATEGQAAKDHAGDAAKDRSRDAVKDAAKDRSGDATKDATKDGAKGQAAKDGIGGVVKDSAEGQAAHA